jgi:8-amino-7-oxononanoate synthase
MATLGKAAGVSGAFVAGETTLIEALIQHARTYVYTTATPPLLAAALIASLKIMESDTSRRSQLQEIIAVLRTGLQLKRWRLAESATPIQPVIIGSNEAAVNASERLLEQGILVPAIRPPTVPNGTARLRISMSAAHTREDVVRLAEALNKIERT